ncbi:MAG: thioredoxin family protein [Armatimonadota bacterium]|jgi:thioredoxin 1
MTKSARLIGVSVAICALVAAACAFAAAAQTVEAAYPGFASDALRYAILTDLPKNVILQTGDYTIGPNDLNAQIRQAPEEYWPQMKRNLFFVLEGLAGNALLQYEADLWAEKNPTRLPENPEETMQVFLDDVTPDANVSDEEVKAYFEAEKAAHPDLKFEDVKDNLTAFLISGKETQLRREYVAGLGKRYVIKIDKTWFAKQHSAAIDNPLDKARKSGKATFAAFTSENCQPCKQMQPTLDAVKKDCANLGNIIIVSTDKDPLLGTRYSVDSVPTQIFFDKTGKEVFRHMGLLTKEQIQEKLTAGSKK